MGCDGLHAKFPQVVDEADQEILTPPDAVYVFNGQGLDVFIANLRRHLWADEQSQIVNIRGIG